LYVTELPYRSRKEINQDSETKASCMLQNYHSEAGKKSTSRARQNPFVCYRTTNQKQESNNPGQRDKIPLYVTELLFRRGKEMIQDSETKFPCLVQNYYSEGERNQPGQQDKILLSVTELPYRSRKEINLDSTTREAYLAI
jgi:ribosome assembly protein YihI (activator of Der GTPase)